MKHRANGPLVNPQQNFDSDEASACPNQVTPLELLYYSETLRWLESLRGRAAEMSTGFDFDPMW